MTLTPWDLPPRIAAKIAVDADSGCWLWTGSRSTKGYGALKVGRSPLGAHRVVYGLAYTIPEGMEIDHLCRMRRCCNPAHLEPVTGAENRRRGVEAAIAPPFYRCGHPRTPGNTYSWTSGARIGRRCRECCRLRKLAARTH